MPRSPAATSTAPRACPTANAVETFWPKYRASSATASGSWVASRSCTRWYRTARRRSGGTPARVVMTPPSSAASRPERRATTPKPVLARPGSMPRTTIRQAFCVPGRMPSHGSEGGRAHGRAVQRGARGRRDRRVPLRRGGARERLLRVRRGPVPAELHRAVDEHGARDLAVVVPPRRERLHGAGEHLGVDLDLRRAVRG